MSEFNIRPAASAPPPSAPAPPAGRVGTTPGPAVRETFAEGGGFKPVGGDTAPKHVRTEGGTSARLIPPAILAKLDAAWAKNEAPAEGGAAPAANGAAAPAQPAAGAPAAAAPADPAKPAEGKPPETTAPAPAPTADEIRTLFGDRPPAAVKAELDRVIEHNRKLAADLEEARKAPAGARAGGAGEDLAEAYIDDSATTLRKFIARAIGAEDPQHADVTAEMEGLYRDLTASLFGVQLDAAQQAARDAAKARQALARDKRSRKAEGDAAAATAQASAEAATAKKAAEFIGNRLSATRTGPDGKPAPSLREQFPLAAALAQRPGARPLEDQILEVYRRELQTGRFDPARLADDDYLISESGKILESYYQDLAETLGKARNPTPSTAPPTPAPAPDATASAAQPPQGHGGRTLTAADSSTAPATLRTSPTNPKPTRPKTREELFDKYGLE